MHTLFLLLIIGITTALSAVTSPTFLQTLTNPGSNGNLQLAVSSNGVSAIAAWTSFPNQVEIQAAFFNGTVWLTNLPQPLAIPNISPTIALGSSPKVGIDQYGIATIVWVTPNNQIRVARYFQNTLIDTNQSIQLTTTGTINSAPTMAVSQDGTVLVVWIQNTPFQVLCSSLIPSALGATWSTPQIFMAIPANNTAGIPANTFGTYPGGGLGLGNRIPVALRNPGFAIWTDGATGAVRVGSLSVP